MNSMNGSTGAMRTNTGAGNEKLRGIDPSMKGLGGYRKFQQFTPEMMELFKSLFQHVGPDSYLSKLAGGDESVFQDIERPGYQALQGQLGALASRFSGMGLGARNTSGFQNMATSAVSDFAQNLMAQRQGLQMNAIDKLRDFSNVLLNQQPYGLVQKRQKDSSSGYGGLIGSLVGGTGGFLLGGPTGAMQGAQLGYGVGSQF